MINEGGGPPPNEHGARDYSRHQREDYDRRSRRQPERELPPAGGPGLIRGVECQHLGDVIPKIVKVLA